MHNAKSEGMASQSKVVGSKSGHFETMELKGFTLFLVKVGFGLMKGVLKGSMSLCPGFIASGFYVFATFMQLFASLLQLSPQLFATFFLSTFWAYFLQQKVAKLQKKLPKRVAFFGGKKVGGGSCKKVAKKLHTVAKKLHKSCKHIQPGTQ